MLDSPFPLQSITDSELQRLAQALWNWDICEPCQSGAPCVLPSCSWRRSARLWRFFDFYKAITASYVPELLPGSKPALRDHADVLDIILLLRANPDTQRHALTHDYFRRRVIKPPPADQHRAFNLVVQVMTMVKCSAENQPSGLLELGTQPLPWHAHASLTEFMSRAFPESERVHVCALDNQISHMKSALRARRLRKVAGLRFRGTDDLRNHLRLDTSKGIVEIFHYTSVLKEQLLASRPSPDSHSLQGAVSEENIPRRVALEALDSVQKILFPFHSDSEEILRHLVSRQSFDPDCLRYDLAGYRMQGEEDISYCYFGGRLIDLFKEQEDPKPHSILEKWFHRKSGARFMMMATLVGVFMAIILGVLGLAVGIFQAWLAYQAWKHPVAAT
ncbi:hypothetical protein G6O67_004520 [Ophiocordyceps sinensis]|uniref:Uncharacterized protein n=1 Tax=Ophiocordyceps sinensis TaxID=72228 RepID=A0A8H4PPK7_9HYPO|nr:hypothetical protein G6O67_004520 [Ophiocordyceps sinensis]